MIQVAAKRNLLFLQLRIRSRNRRRHHLIGARMLPRLHHRMKSNPMVLASPKPVFHCAGTFQRNHKRKGFVRRKRLQMSPPNQILIFAPPRRLLILRIAHNPRGPKFPHRQVLHRSRLRARQHNSPLHIFPSIIALVGPLAHVHQLRRHIRAFAVLGQHNRLRFITGQQFCVFVLDCIARAHHTWMRLLLFRVCYWPLSLRLFATSDLW